MIFRYCPTLVLYVIKKQLKLKANSLVKFFFELGSLRKIARSHRQALGTDDVSDNIASHSYRVAAIGYYLAKLEKADPFKVLAMCLFHDAGEARSGDANAVHKKYVKVFEEEILADQFLLFLSDTSTFAILKEYAERKSKESLVAKDADLLDQILLEKEYELRGNQEASRWLKSKSTFKRLITPSAKRLAKEIYRQKPSDWWTQGLFTFKRR